MSKPDTKDLWVFLQPFAPEIQQLALDLRNLVWDLYPGSNELIYDNYNTLAFGWSTTEKLGDTFCSLAVVSKYLHFGFYWGNRLSDPEKRLLGKGNQYRYVVVRTKADFPEDYIKALMDEAYANSLAGLKDPANRPQGKTITKSISPVKKRPGIPLPPRKKKST